MIGKTSKVQNRSKLIFQRHWAWSRTTNDDQILILKKGIWLYFFLLIFEGALRKWFLPFLATPLLIVRDPIALLLLLKSWQYRLLPPNFYVFAFQSIGVLGIYTAFFFGHGNPWVALFGARIFLIHFPMIFVIGQIFNREDVVQMGRMILLIAIPMTFLIALQYYSPQSAWVNRGVAGDINGAGFSGIGSFYRPPATFSFTNGTTLFYNVVGCYVLYFWFHQKEIKKWLLIGSTLSLVAAVPLSLSRGLSLQIGLSFLFVIIAISRKPQYAGRIIAAIISAIIIISVFSKLSFFETSLTNLTGRFELASNAEGNLENILNNRFIGGLIGSLKESFRVPFFGYGLGMGTNAGGFLLSGGHDFLISELEWARIIGEMGPLMGLIVIFLRLLLGVKITIGCYKKLAENDFLPWMLLSLALFSITQGGWGQPTSLGFCVVIVGLTLASMKPLNSRE